MTRTLAMLACVCALAACQSVKGVSLGSAKRDVKQADAGGAGDGAHEHDASTDASADADDEHHDDEEDESAEHEAAEHAGEMP